ncbi:hypothetical protein [Vibrio neptunius]|uniref:Transposase n=1 Tax=Vibrio neptunius TaxID=170651 RepID=A0ABS3A6Y6_9VIBR|nr:hypothetical protein [Vibrio neptunius]MBN3495164.1 hypothetical protein [Vibrio neptunius]MBN3517634.1 hypothetical protein [Vibrio neptunius]MBN3552015.1 hypothetical protein [Vibrio neptunius]MBN3579979.1 hypothetical protein [Vibrio neptunius]MCH9873645.1 hypothetical protein [Vibrio neptunius]
MMKYPRKKRIKVKAKRPSKHQVRQVLLQTACVLLQDERYKVPIEESEAFER